MPYCLKCYRVVCSPCEEIKPAPKTNFVVVATDDQLRRQSHFQRLAIATKALGLSRRKVPDWIADEIFTYEGMILEVDGRDFLVGDNDIDAAFNDDGSFRWLSDFLDFANRTSQQAPQHRVLARLRLIDLAFRIAHPDRAYLIAK